MNPMLRWGRWQRQYRPFSYLGITACGIVLGLVPGLAGFEAQRSVAWAAGVIVLLVVDFACFSWALREDRTTKEKP